MTRAADRLDGVEADLWRKAVDRLLEDRAFDETLVSHSADGIPVGPLYVRAEAPPPLSARHGSRRVRIHQRIDHPAPADAASLMGQDLEEGAEGLDLVVAGSVSARGFGVAVADIGAVLDALPLDRAALRLDPPPFDGREVADVLLDAIDRRRPDPSRLDIDLGLDPLGDMARCGGAPLPWPRLASVTGADIAALQAHALGGLALRADGRPHHDGGASEAQELGAVLATATAYLRMLDEAGLALDEARLAISFLMVAETDLLLSISKFRALRHLWASVEQACGLTPRPIRLHAETAWRSMTRRDAHTNLLRSTLCAAAAMIGGADGLTVLPFTLPLGLPDAAARRLARNTALILRDEAHLAAVADPAAGAGAIETLTSRLCDEAWAIFQDIERAGGMAAALASGVWQGKIGAMRERRRASIAQGATQIVGTTLFPAAGESPHCVLAAAEDGPQPPTDWAERFAPLSPGRDAEPWEAIGPEANA